jgi:ATP-dependent RNA helicase DDX27
MKAIQDLGFEKPTIIQEMTIPAIVTGRDVLASSITGSGKTAAFLLPLIQKFWKAKYGYNVSNYSKALIILPTRELAIQCHDMFHGLNKYTKLSSTLIIGQASIQQQEMELRRGPDFIIGTPGRMIDLIKNSKDVSLDEIESLIFDEADKLLDMGFKAEVQEIVDLTNSGSRQTLLFSATLGKDVQKIIRISLNKPLVNIVFFN